MRFRVLGPLEVYRWGMPVAVGGPRQRAVLGALLMRANKLSTVAYLTDAAWEKSPASPESNIRTYVSDLRRRLGDSDGAGLRLVARQGGYVLNVWRGELDAVAFEELVDLGDRELRAGDTGAAADHLAQALTLWSSRPFEGLEVGPTLRTEAARLEDRRTYAAERYARAAGDLGRYEETVRVLRGLVREYPLREELWAELMSAHLTAGYRAEALDTDDGLARCSGE
jgi:DNA-binding SARP family transcriptional activator